jgi:hypothetical protein
MNVQCETHNWSADAHVRVSFPSPCCGRGRPRSTIFTSSIPATFPSSSF